MSEYQVSGKTRPIGPSQKYSTLHFRNNSAGGNIFFSSIIKHINLKTMRRKTIKKDSDQKHSKRTVSISHSMSDDDDDGASRSSASSSSSDKSTCTSESQPEPSRNETRLVRGSKVLVLVILLVAAAACGAATYIFTSRGEEAAFHDLVSQKESICCLLEEYPKVAYNLFCCSPSDLGRRFRQ
jgi:hypothetical protein